MAALGLVVLWFLLSFLRMVLLQLIKLAVCFLPLVLGAPFAAWFWLERKPYYAGGVLLVTFVVSIIWYPRKKKGKVSEVGVAYSKWPDTFRGRLLDRIDKRIAKS
jgi:hypothetical protein